MNSYSADKYHKLPYNSVKATILFLTWVALSWPVNHVFGQQHKQPSFQSYLSTSQHFQFHKSQSVEPEPDKNYLADDILQYSPVIAVYALNALGIEGKHRFLERTFFLAGSYVIMGATVYGLKTVIDAPRPDGSDNNSFPSGHTAIAFMGAEFFRKEYSDKSPWYGVTGYALAATTAYLRLHHNRHRPIDVAAGAFIGVLSTQAAYLLGSYVSQKLFPSHNSSAFSAQLSPFIGHQKTGMILLLRF